MVMTLKQITEAIGKRHFETVKKELCRYGDVLDLKDWTTRHGEHRCYIIKRLDSVFVITMLNGKTTNIIPQ